MIFFRMLTVVYCEASRLMIKSVVNRKALSGSQNLIMTSSREPKDTIFQFDKTNEIGERKEGMLYKDNEENKRMYMYFSNLKKRVYLHSDVHKVFITKKKNYYTISDVNNNCLTVDDDNVRSTKCKDGDKNQQFIIYFYKSKAGRRGADKHSVSIDGEREISQKRNGTKYKDTIDIYVDSDEGSSVKEHQRMKAKESREDSEMVLVEKPRALVTENEKEIGPIIKGVPRQSTNIVEKPAIVREKIVADVLTTTISTTVHTTSTETITKLDIITEYLPQASYTTVVVPASRILPPVYTKNVGDESGIKPSVQVEESQADMHISGASSGHGVEVERSNIQMERVKPIKPSRNLKRKHLGESQITSQRRLSKKPVKRRKIQSEISDEESQHSSNNSYSDSYNEEEEISKTKPKPKRRLKKVVKDAKNKVKGKKVNKSQNKKYFKSGSDSEDHESESYGGNVDDYEVERGRAKESRAKGSRFNRKRVKETSGKELDDSENVEIFNKRKNYNKKKDGTIKRTLKRIKMNKSEDSSDPSFKSKTIKSSEKLGSGLEVSGHVPAEYDSNVIKNVMKENIKQEDNLFDEVRLSDFTGDLKGTDIEHMIGMEKDKSIRSQPIRSKQKQFTNYKQTPSASQYVARKSPSGQYASQQIRHTEQPAVPITNNPVQTAPAPVSQTPKSTLKNKETHIVISQPLKVVAPAPPNQQVINAKPQDVYNNPAVPSTPKAPETIEEKFLAGKPLDDTKTGNQHDDGFASGNVFSEFLGELAMV